MPTPNEALNFSNSDPQTVLAAGEHHDRVRKSALGAREALLKQYGSDVAAVYQAQAQAFGAEAAPVEPEFEGNDEPEGLAPAA